MDRYGRHPFTPLFAAAALLVSTLAFGQQPVILGPDELGKVVPTNFFFEGQVAPTQMRNAAAVRFAPQRHLIVALVDTSGYASDIRAKYEGFIILDEAVTIGGVEVKSGAYGFGFTKDSKMNLLDLGGKTLHSVTTKRDEKLQSPRPLAVVQSGKELRLYHGKDYVLIASK